MGQCVNLLKNYPQSKRNTSERASVKNEEIRKIAREFGEEFFDGDRAYGYGGFSYNPKYWNPVIPTFQEYWNLDSKSSILDIGCAKGFMIYDFINYIPDLNIKGIDISNYAIENSKEEVKNLVTVGDAKSLDFEDNSFDYVISINTIHNLKKNECFIALKEIQRVSRISSFITVDAYNNDEEKKRMFDWNLTAKTIMSTSEWIDFFDEAEFTGDYYWFIP
jgi:SAM-dependent methyltransferase